MAMLNEVHPNRIAELLCDDYYTVSVSINGSPRVFKVNNRHEVTVGQGVVIHTRKGLEVAEVAEVHRQPKIDYNEGHHLGWVVQPVHLDIYQSMVERDERLKEDAESELLRIKREQALSLLPEGLVKLAKKLALAVPGK